MMLCYVLLSGQLIAGLLRKGEDPMNPFSAFSAKGKWYKGNCHTHTTLSDGRRSPEETARAYRRKGYDFLVMTDHGRTHESVAHLQREDFLVINGVELHPPTNAPAGFTHHLVGIGTEKIPSRETIKKGTAASAIRWIKRQGGIPIYAHPYWTGHDTYNLKEGRAALGMEVFNTTCEVARGLGDASAHLDQALSHGFRWKVLAVDDAHRVERDGFRGWIMVKARSLTRAAIMRAIAKGRFYSTCGPVIRSVRLKGGVARIVCSPVAQIVWHTAGAFGRCDRPARGKKRMTTAKFVLGSLTPEAGYFRVEITDTCGRKAWTNPIFRDRRTGKWSD